MPTPEPKSNKPPVWDDLFAQMELLHKRVQSAHEQASNIRGRLVGHPESGSHDDAEKEVEPTSFIAKMHTVLAKIESHVIGIESELGTISSG